MSTTAASQPTSPRIAAAILAGGKATRYGGVAKGLLRLWEPRPRGDSLAKSPGGPGSHITIIARLVRVIRSAGISEIVICAGRPPTAEGALPCAPTCVPTPYEGLGLPIIPDVVPNAGPLGGIAAALRHFAGGPHPSLPSPSLERGCLKDKGGEGRADGVLILPCDMPAITEREIGALVEAFAWRVARASSCTEDPCSSQAKACGTPPLIVAVTGDDEMQPLCAVLRPLLLDEVIRAIEAGELAVGRLWRKVGAEVVRFPDPAPFANVNTPEEMAAWVETMGG